MSIKNAVAIATDAGHHQNALIRQQAHTITIVGIMNEQQLIRALGDKEKATRDAAAIFAMNSGTDRARFYACLYCAELEKALKMGDAQQLAAEALQHGNAVIREGAAYVLSIVRDVQAEESLISALSDEECVRQAVAKALGRIGTDRAMFYANAVSGLYA